MYFFCGLIIVNFFRGEGGGVISAKLNNQRFIKGRFLQASSTIFGVTIFILITKKLNTLMTLKNFSYVSKEVAILRNFRQRAVLSLRVQETLKSVLLLLHFLLYNNNNF